MKYIVIKPDQKQESSATEGNLKKICPKKHGDFCSENVKTGKEETIVINCTDVNTKKKIKRKVEEELRSKYSVTKAKEK